jgi:hypothetical protein
MFLSYRYIVTVAFLCVSTSVFPYFYKPTSTACESQRLVSDQRPTSLFRDVINLCPGGVFIAKQCGQHETPTMNRSLTSIALLFQLSEFWDTNRAVKINTLKRRGKKVMVFPCVGVSQRIFII